MSSIVSPDCRDQNHQKCPGDAWDEVHDHATECQCACHSPLRPSIVDVIANVLEAHGQDYPQVDAHCYCGKEVRENMHVHQAQAVLDALTKTRTIETVEELIAAEDPGIILKDKCGHPYKWDIDMNGEEGWISPHDQTVITSRHLWKLAPITILDEPQP